MASKRKSAKSKREVWFVKVRGSYLPASWQGWLLYLPFTTFLVVVFINAVQEHNTLKGAFYMIFPQWVAAAVVMTWIASKKS